MKPVLVVDDSADIREIIRMLLESKGHSVVEAVNGEEAVALALEISPSLILMDLSMPVLDGFDATRQIRSRSELSDVPVVAVSAYCDVHNRQKALAAGCVECVAKPINFGVIGTVVDRYLSAGPIIPHRK